MKQESLWDCEQKERKVFVNSEMPFDLAHRARLAAAKLDISRSELIRQALEEYLEKLNEPIKL